MKATVFGKDFNDLIDATKAFTSKDDHKPIYQTIQLNVDIEAKTVTAYAVDGYRLSKETRPFAEADRNFIVHIWPPKIKADKKKFVEIRAEDGIAYVSYLASGITFQTRASGDYLDCEKTLMNSEEKPCEYRIGLNPDYLADALRAAKVSVNGKKHPIAIEFRTPTSPVFISTPNGKRMILPVLLKSDC